MLWDPEWSCPFNKNIRGWLLCGVFRGSVKSFLCRPSILEKWYPFILLQKKEAAGEELIMRALLLMSSRKDQSRGSEDGMTSQPSQNGT